MADTTRSRAKADRASALLEVAAHLFAEHGFAGVSIEDLGAGVGVSGPAVYRYFDSKQAVLGAILVGASEGLLAGGRSVVSCSIEADAALRALVAFHVDFAMTRPNVIRVQDRDLNSLRDPERHTVRALQRRYVELWVDTLAKLRPDEGRPHLRTRAHATFGLINSTPHSDRGRETRGLFEEMALAALLSRSPS